jgi:hypothetical protein
VRASWTPDLAFFLVTSSVISLTIIAVIDVLELSRPFALL